MHRDKVAPWVARVLAKMLPEPDSECIRWGGYINNLNGYGQCNVSVYYRGLMRPNGTSPEMTSAHRVTYSLFRGPIPDGMHLDHLTGCEHHWCVNPYHTEPTWPTENARLANLRRWHGHRDVVQEQADEGVWSGVDDGIGQAFG